MRLFNPRYYYLVHLVILSMITIVYFFEMRKKGGQILVNRKKTSFIPLLYAGLFTIVIGLRPISYVFGDTVNYANTYARFAADPIPPFASRDTLFYIVMWFFAHHVEIYWFFLFCEILYMFPMVIACKRMFRNNTDIAILFCMAAFSFFTYGVNGVRNGIACSMVMMAVSLFKGSSRDNIICIIVSIIAYCIHASSLLPLVCLAATHFIRSPRWFFRFWVLSIVISLVAGSSISNFFANLGFDDRLSDYILSESDEDIFSAVGFRWDFLLYSAVPIVYGYYIIVRKRVYDPTYIKILGTYILANAFWIMVIRANYSNRFAYLSWFLFPIALAYPSVKLLIWPNTQGRKASNIMMGNLAFTLFMTFIYG